MEFRPPYRPVAPPLDEDEFWRLWDGLRAESGGDLTRTVELLGDRVVNGLDDDAIQALQVRFIDVTGRLHTWRHRAVVELLLGECTEHAFPYFAAFLVAHGRATFDLLAADADALGDVKFAAPPDDMFVQLTFGTELPQYAYAFGDAIGGAVMVRRPNGADDDFDRTHPAWASTAAPAGVPYGSAAAAGADLPRTAAATGNAAALQLPDWQLVRRNRIPLTPQLINVSMPRESDKDEGTNRDGYGIVPETEIFLERRSGMAGGSSSRPAGAITREWTPERGDERPRRRR